MATPYHLAIDVGTSRTAAATARSAPDGALVAAPLPLGRNADSTPTTVFISDSGLLFGDAAERRGTAQPERLVREFKRRIGDDVPIVAGDRRFSPQDLYALVVGWVIGTAVEREGQHPASIAVSVPVTWGEYRTQLVQDAIGRLGWSDVQVITEPEAAARHYEATHPLDTGRALAVYDFGGGTFDTVILQKAADGRVDFVGSPVGIPDLGGADFDDIVLRHTVRAAGIPASALAGAESDAGTRMALASLRRECVDAKESLSFDGEAVVPVLVGDGHGAVRLTRAEFEDMIEPEIERTVEVLEVALEQSGLTADDLDAILLTGGTSRIPRVAQLLSERFDRPIAVDADPKAIIALGAARTAAAAPAGEIAPVAMTAAVDDDVITFDEDDDHDDADSGFTAERAEKRAPWFRRLPATAYVAAGVAALTVSVGVISVPALGVGILARTGFGAVSQPLAADLEVRLFDPLDLPSSPPASIAAPQVKAAEQPAAPQEQAAAPEEPSAQNRTEERKRSPQRLTPQAAEQRSPSAAPQQQASGGGSSNGGGGNASGSSNPAPATQPSSSEPSASAGTPSTAPSTAAPSPTDPGPTTPATQDPTPSETGGSGDPTPVETGGSGGTGDGSGGDGSGGSGGETGTETGGETPGSTESPSSTPEQTPSSVPSDSATP